MSTWPLPPALGPWGSPCCPLVRRGQGRSPGGALETWRSSLVAEGAGTPRSLRSRVAGPRVSSLFSQPRMCSPLRSGLQSRRRHSSVRAVSMASSPTCKGVEGHCTLKARSGCPVHVCCRHFPLKLQLLVRPLHPPEALRNDLWVRNPGCLPTPPPLAAALPPPVTLTVRSIAASSFTPRGLTST